MSNEQLIVLGSNVLIISSFSFLNIWCKNKSAMLGWYK